MCTLPFSYTLIRSLPDDPEFVLSDTGCFMLLIRYWERITSIIWSRSSLLLDHLFSVFSISFLFHFFHDSMQWTHSCFIPLFICYHAWMFICDIVVMLIYHSDYVACSSYFRLNVYAWSIFLVYIHCRFSSRLRFHVFWEAGRDNFISIHVTNIAHWQIIILVLH